mmetsp:Transcript_46661/g.99842  ORF Transcript_46661/g.99842 Transcript_46661/m.99842 type:complete len:419 (+) Transcript_46661:1-1257(+)
MALAMRKAGVRSSLSSFEPTILFSSLGMNEINKMTATGAADPTRLPHVGHTACRLNMVLDMLPDEDEGKKSSADSAPLERRKTKSIAGEVKGLDCGLSILFDVSLVDVVGLTQRVVHYSIWVNLLTILQMRFLIQQMRHTEDGPSAGRVSIVCIAMQAAMDAYDAFLHLCLGLSSQYKFNTIAVIVLFKFILFSLETRYMLPIWRHRYPDLFNQGWEVVRREFSWIYSRFYGMLVLGMVMLYHNMESLDYIVLMFQLYLVPQIACDAWQGCKTALCPSYYLGMAAVRLLYFLYLWGCPEGIFSDELYPQLPGAPNATTCLWFVLVHVIQLAIISSQQRWGPRWFIPWVCMPLAYNYHRSSSVDPGTDCVICMIEIDPEEARKCVTTPCNHKFHQSCLEQWMEVKMECPTCRTLLPPIQ